jgi:hypothetical protein
MLADEPGGRPLAPEDIPVIEEEMKPGDDIPVIIKEEIPSDDKTVSILTGFGIIFCILLFSTMFTVTPLLSGTVTAAGLQKPSSPVVSDTDTAQKLPTVTSTSTPSVTPAIISSAPVTQTAQPAIPKSYVTIEAVPTTVKPQLQDLSVNLPDLHYDNYFTIYSLNGQQVQQNLPYVSFNLINPPLVIDYTVIPLNITDVKDVKYKILSTEYNEKLVLNRPYEQARFRLVVRDRETGKVVLEEGYGEPYSLESSKQLFLYKGGNYRFEFSGDYATIDLTLKVKKEGNIN